MCARAGSSIVDRQSDGQTVSERRRECLAIEQTDSQADRTTDELNELLAAKCSLVRMRRGSVRANELCVARSHTDRQTDKQTDRQAQRSQSRRRQATSSSIVYVGVFVGGEFRVDAIC